MQRPAAPAFAAASLLPVLLWSCAGSATTTNAPGADPAPLAREAQPQPEGVRPESLEQGFVLVVRDKSGMADEDNPIHIATSKNGWNPGDPAMKLEPRSDGRWQIVFDQPEGVGPMEFKFTLGDWSRVEVGPEGNDIDNRRLPDLDPASIEPGRPPVVELVVESFREPGDAHQAQMAADGYRDLGVTGTVRRVQVTGGAALAQAHTRQLLVWLPPGYDLPDNADRSYPVLYLHDGQNIFEQLPGVPGEWHADETATDLIAQGITEPVIIVGIPHSGGSRAQEYIPYPNAAGVEPQGDDHVRWLHREVFPRVESIFRVTDDPAQTYIGGASLGAVISLYAATDHPERFGGFLLESIPDIAPNDRARDALLTSIMRLDGRGLRVYIGVGGSETGTEAAARPRNDRYVQWSTTIAEALERAGAEVHLLVVPEDRHNEDAWADRFDEALRFLAPAN